MTHSGSGGKRWSSWTSTPLHPPSAAQLCTSQSARPPLPGTEDQMRRSAQRRRIWKTPTWVMCSPTATGSSSDWAKGRWQCHSEGPSPDLTGRDQDPPELDQMETLERREKSRHRDIELQDTFNRNRSFLICGTANHFLNQFRQKIRRMFYITT